MKIIARSGIVFLFAALIQFGIVFSDALLPAAEGNNYNVLLITIDTIRPDRLSCYSTKYLKTPNIDALADKGVLFERAFAHNSITLPSHANILLGTTPLYHGVHDNAKFKISEDSLTMAEFLKSKGYATAAFIGAFSLDSRFGLNQGFDVYDESYPAQSSVVFVPPERTAGEVIKPALEWLEGQDSKWFCWIHLWDPHVPYKPPEPFSTQYEEDPYSGEVAYVDAELKKIFDFIDNEYLRDYTLIILTGDHGESLGEHGELSHTYFAYNSTIWVPLMMAGPGIGSSRIENNVCHIDIFPTLCDILNVEKPAFLQGVSLLPLMNGKKFDKRPIFFESLGPYYNQGWAPQWGFIEDNKKFIDSPIPEFYDLDSDFNELNNIIENIDVERYLEKLDELKDNLTSSRKSQNPQQMDREAQEKLRSLGYLISPTSNIKESYGPEDDLKTLLPIQKKLDQAIILGDEGKMEESAQLLNEIIAEQKNFAQAYLYLYQIHIDLGQKDKVMEILEKGMNNNPQNYAIISTFGVFLVREEQFDRGIEVLQKALSLLDFDPDAWHYLGFAYWRKKDNQKAFEYYRKAISLDDSDPMVYYNLGMLHLSIFMDSKKRVDHRQAMESFKKAIKYNRDFALAYRGLGIGYRIQGQTRDAILVWEQALQLSPNDEFLLSSLGDANREIGNKVQAIKYFESYLSIKSITMTPAERNKIENLLRELKKD